MKWLDYTIKLLHIVATAGAYATVFEVILKAILERLSH